MTTLRDIVQRGFRESGIVGVGTQPDGDEFDEAFDHLQTIIRSLFGNELGDPLTTYDVGLSGVQNSPNVVDVTDVTEQFVPDNTRLIFNAEGPTSLYLNPTPRDGTRLAILDNLGNFSTLNVTLYGNGRRIEGAASLVLNTDQISREWFYRDDLGNWVRVTDLTPSDDSPLPEEFDDLLITLLAIRINPRYGAETNQETSDVLKRMRSQLRSRYRQNTEMSSELGLILMPSRNQYIKNNFTLGS